MEKAFHQKKTKNREGNPPNLPQDTVCLGNQQAGFVRKCCGKMAVVGLNDTAFQYDSSNVVYEHGDQGNPFRVLPDRTGGNKVLL